MPDQHAKLSASSAKRWIMCPGSIHMAELFPESTSDSAEEGTLAHELAAAMIGYNASEHPDKKAFNRTIKTISEKVDAFYALHEKLSGSFEDMQRILDPYADYVWGEFQEIKKADSSAVLMTEQRVDFSEYVPGGFGTSDVVIVGAGKIEVIDLKYGKGVPISAVGNPQIRLYGLGAIAAFDLIYDFTGAKLVIYQPRLDSVTEEQISVEDLNTWAAEVIKPAADLALGDSPPYHAGDWCSSCFCPGNGTCRERAAYCLALERHSGKDPALLTDDELADAMERAAVLTKWVRDLDSYCLIEILSGHAIPGWKVVEGRSVRKYSDEVKVAEAAKAAGFKDALLYERSLIGISAMEKLMGKKQFNDVLGSLIYKPPGNPTLAPESDKRPPFSPLAADFED